MSYKQYPPLELPSIDISRIEKGTRVQTRTFYGNSLPGAQAVVVRIKQDKYKNWWVRCNYGKNLSGQSLLKWMPANVLAFSIT